MCADDVLQNVSDSKPLVRTFQMLTEHFPGPCGPFVVVTHVVTYC